MTTGAAETPAVLHIANVRQMTYPGQNGELLIETKEGFGGVEMSSYARINSLETAVLRDLGDYWEEPASYFLGPGHLLKEVVDDMEWAGNSIAVEVQRDPPRIEFASDGSSSGNGVGGASQGSGPVGIVQFMLLPEDGGEE
eukprot:jgi/Tetstr1/435333/TSEL_024252.t1